MENNKRVIPILVGGADIPRAGALPEAVRPLARRNAVELRPERFRADCQGLITALKEQLAAAARERAARTEEIGRSEEIANWVLIRSRNDIRALRDHLARFPNGEMARRAFERLDQLVWKALGVRPDITQLRAYLDEFPAGAHTTEALARIAVLEKWASERARTEAEDWDARKTSPDVWVFEGFLKRWPQGQHAAEARERIAQLKNPQGGGWVVLIILILCVIGLTFLAGRH